MVTTSLGPSHTKTSHLTFVSPATRLEAKLVNATRVPSELIAQELDTKDLFVSIYRTILKLSKKIGRILSKKEGAIFNRG